MIDLNESLIFRDLSPNERSELQSLAQKRTYSAGETLFQDGDPATELIVHIQGRCVFSQSAHPIGEAHAGDVLDAVSTLGGLQHSIRAVAMTDCECICWSMADLWQSEAFAIPARQFLASTVQQTQERLSQLEAPIHSLNTRGELSPGPFQFKNARLLIAFCDADLDAIRDTLPDGLRIFRRTGRKRDSMFLAIADFPDTHSEDKADARFSYTETTCFIPVRYGKGFGLFPLYIYPSTWEPILLGREIYGFPKQLGNTVFMDRQVTLSVDADEQFNLSWNGSESSSEPRLVRALSDWVGIEGRVASAAFQVGNVLMQAMRLPPYRRVDVYNHKRVPAVRSTIEQPRYDVNVLTQAIFGVLRWHKITRLENVQLDVTGSILQPHHLQIREAYDTRLDMRLSVGRIVRDYRDEG